MNNSMVAVVICAGAQKCGVSTCRHSEAHEYESICDGICLNTNGCVPVQKSEKRVEVKLGGC